MDRRSIPSPRNKLPVVLCPTRSTSVLGSNKAALYSSLIALSLLSWLDPLAFPGASFFSVLSHTLHK